MTTTTDKAAEILAQMPEEAREFLRTGAMPFEAKVMQTEPAYLIWSNQHSAWWRADGCGYTSNINDAGWYSREKAISICATSRDGWGHSPVPPEMPVLLSDVTECIDLFKSMLRERGK